MHWPLIGNVGYGVAAIVCLLVAPRVAPPTHGWICLAGVICILLWGWAVLRMADAIQKEDRS